MLLIYRQFILTLTLILLSACATLDGPPDKHDPWEGFNRSMFNFNDKLDKTILKPVAKGYKAITPDPVESGVSNFFNNLGEIKTILNGVFQLKFLQALSDTGRLIVNSTVGIYGLFDVASHIGLEEHNEDFGQTLGYWGAGPGPYIVLPFFGPSSLRDGPAGLVDQQFNPLREVDDDTTRMSLYVLDVVDTRAQLLEAGDLLDEASLDPYIFMREAYLQSRKNEIYDGNPPMEEDEDEIDIFDDEE